MSLFLSVHEDLIHGLILKGSYAHPVSLASICRVTMFSERRVKDIVESLGNEHDVPVGARRGKPNGYFIAQTVEEREAAARPLVRQGAKMIHRARRLLGPPARPGVAGARGIVTENEIDAIRKRFEACPIPLDAVADYAGTNHYEIHDSTSNEFWWLELYDLDEVDSSTEQGKRVGAVLDYACAYRRDVGALLAALDAAGEKP